jgi:hypothetical protein
MFMLAIRDHMTHHHDALPRRGETANRRIGTWKTRRLTAVVGHRLGLKIVKIEERRHRLATRITTRDRRAQTFVHMVANMAAADVNAISFTHRSLLKVARKPTHHKSLKPEIKHMPDLWLVQEMGDATTEYHLPI